MKTSIAVPCVVLAMYLTVSTLDYQPPPAVEYAPFMTIVEVMESAPPPVPEFDLARYIERKTCIPLRELMESAKPLGWPAAILAGGIEFVLDILCSEVML
jgi:hypothetical protein